MSIGQLLRIAMPQADSIPTKWAVFHYTRPNNSDDEPDREETGYVFETFDEAADKAEDLDAGETRSGHWYGADEIEAFE